MNEIELKNGMPPTPGYRYASKRGNQLYVSGQVPQDQSGSIVGIDSPAEQARQCLENLDLLLSCHNFEIADVQRLVIYVVGGRENLTTTWEAVAKHFSCEVPPATLIGVALLGYEGQLVEMDATVVREEAVT